MSDGLIDPSKIFVPKVEAADLEAAAADIRKQGGNIAQNGQDIKSSWAGLASCYTAPEDEVLLAVVDPVAEKGDEVDGDLGEVASALETFAETARDLQAKLDIAKQDAQSFVDSVEGDDSWKLADFLGYPTEKMQEHNALLDRVATLTHRYQEAERECANRITALFKGGTTFIGGDPQGGTDPGNHEKIYGTEQPLTGQPAPWGEPQGSAHPFLDLAHGQKSTEFGDTLGIGQMIGVLGAGGLVGSKSEWKENLQTYWGDTLAQTASMVGQWNPETGARPDSLSESIDVGLTAWGNAAHGLVPWTEWEQRPGYVLGVGYENLKTVGTSVASGVALTFVPGGVFVGPMVTGGRVLRTLGKLGQQGNGPFTLDGGSVEYDPGGRDGSGTGNRLPDGSPGGGSTSRPLTEPPSDIDPDAGFDLSDIGDMNESLDELNDARSTPPRWQPDPAPAPDPDYTPDQDGDANAPPRPSPEAERPAETDADQQAEQDPSGPDLTAEEVDDSFAEIARRNEDVGDSMDTADEGRMAELDGEDPWSIEALEDPRGDVGGGSDPDEGTRVPVTPDGMEMSHYESGDGNEGSDGSEYGDASDGDGRAVPQPDHKPRLGGSEGSFGRDDTDGHTRDIEPPSGEDRPRPDPAEEPPLEETYLVRGEDRFRGFVGGHTGKIHRVGWMDENGYYYDDRGNVYVEEPDSLDALKKYQEIRRLEGDTTTISENTGIDKTVLDRVKQHLFFREHAVATDPGKHRVGLFSPTDDIASKWMSATENPLSGRALHQFRRLMIHEGVESALMEHGITYRSTHPDYYDSRSYPYAGPRNFGAHDLAPGEYGNMWAVTDRIGIRRPDFEINQDLSNLDRLIDHVLREIDDE
ncbi:hypothetical protein [Streptomonospora litoralis]|uniref:Uncharacterized protein n=1 Tax=Streptomonospora litoralis TaxID=2498135 RepID=A0A4P6PZA4_9ACTN|nr:hypothetical protein [Streptomonospora litoralis]QBI52231.1 hypothetical protein EKD16_02075 [Streptomonospora litoralis]